MAPSGMSQAGLRETLRNPSTRPDATDRDLLSSGTATTASQSSASRAPLVSDPRDIDALQSLAALSSAAARQQTSPMGLSSSSHEASQESSNTVGAESVFTPPASQNDTTRSQHNGHSSSQESQLLQLSQLAAARTKMDEPDAMMPSRKRGADGEVKDPSRSPVRGGHSRNTSTVSMTSTTTSTIGDVSPGALFGRRSQMLTSTRSCRAI